MDKAELISKDQIREDIPEIKSGTKVKVYEKIKEGSKQRIAQFSGIVIATKHGSKTVNGTFTVRTVLDGVGVEKTWPIHSPLIEKIEVLDVLKTRRSKLYYIRNLSPKKLRKKLRPLREFIGLKKKQQIQTEQSLQAKKEQKNSEISEKSENSEKNQQQEKSDLQAKDEKNETKELKNKDPQLENKETTEAEKIDSKKEENSSQKETLEDKKEENADE